MSWFDEQIRYRKEKDDNYFLDAIDDIAGAVMGQQLVNAFDDKKVAQSAIEEVLAFFHMKKKTDEIPSSITTVDGQLEYTLRPLGVMRRTVNLEKGWYKNAVGVMLGTLKEDGTAVALVPSKFSGYTFMNLKTGKREKVTRRNENLFDEEALCFYKPFPLRKLKTVDILKFMMQQMNVSDIILYLSMIGISTLLGLLGPRINKWLFGEVLESGSLRVLLSLAVFMISFIICKSLITAFQNLIKAKIEVKVDVAVQAAVMSRVMILPTTFFKKYASGDLYMRTVCVQNFCKMLLTTVGTTGITTAFSLVYLFQISSLSPSLGLPALIVTLLTLAVTVSTAILQTKVNEELIEEKSKSSGITYSMITGIQKIKLAGAEKRMFSRWAKEYAKEAKLEYNSPLLLRLSKTLTLAVSLIGTLVFYTVAVKNNVSVSDYYAFDTSFALITAAFTAFSLVVSSIANIKPSLEMQRPIMEQEPEINDGQRVVSELMGAVELENVYFRYSEDMPYVINNLSLKIRPGEYVAIVGATGCGKSTLFRLLLGFEKPERGAIYYDRKDISYMDLKSLRQNIGTVLQDGKLFLGDIYSNIVISAPQLTIDDAWEAAKIASVDEDIKAMPMGMHTIISEGSGGVSGGQKQRLMIARAVASKPKILMFDEATSALDNMTQKKVSDAIDNIKATRIVIAHRLSTIRHCDRIIVLDKGNIVESGKYEQLIENNGYFAELVKRQRLDVEDE